MTDMKKSICASMVRKEIVQKILVGGVCLVIGVALVPITGVFSGPLLNVLESFAKNFAYISVILILTLGGGALFIHGIRGLFHRETTDLCKNIRAQLPSGEYLTGAEMIALVDKDLDFAQEFAHGEILIGKEWMIVPKTMGGPIVRLQNIQRIDCKGNRDTGFHLKFVNQYGYGPVSGELTAVDVDIIKRTLQNKVPDLKV